ncbi:hypothetical protein [Massilia aquatica]|uniref:Uncharacterized protein n=1 Tax=Massilia aquatica TaxID=2609000 RepID=A0ABX0MPX7_9BURK|nr:hypothetical protein [Massilia aquatica]NHZ44271.1 hypothetical protein [Massilia aquatica]
MSQDIVLISMENLSNPDIEAWLLPRYRLGHGVLINRVAVLYVHDHDEEDRQFSYVRISELIPSHEVADDYKDHDILDVKLKMRLETCRYYHVTFNNYEFYEKIMATILTGMGDDIDSCWIDDSYGRLVPGKDVLAKLNGRVDAQ